MDILSALAADPNVDPALRRVFASPRKDYLTIAADKADPRRFTGAPMTGFGALSEDEHLDAQDRRTEQSDADLHREMDREVFGDDE